MTRCNARRMHRAELRMLFSKFRRAFDAFIGGHAPVSADEHVYGSGSAGYKDIHAICNSLFRDP